EEQGYEPSWSAALVSVAGVLALLIPPPRNPFILYWGVTETPVGSMFLAGILPGILLVIILLELAGGIPGPPSEKAMEGLVAIKAPMLGTFYRTPKPGAPPFVEVGAMVDKDDPVGIIEVMKLFNTVKAGVQGRIAQICAEQGQLVEYQQILFLIENKSG
ncbi:MAG: TRAP transporter large permease subunit, partial [Deltaproteobacteria bacterium]|nr:TRAP transporter large permease subunit [Deltaproteobacteria bacterium]